MAVNLFRTAGVLLSLQVFFLASLALAQTTAPMRPSKLRASVNAPSTIQVRWKDRSSDELRFEVQVSMRNQNGRYVFLRTIRRPANRTILRHRVTDGNFRYRVRACSTLCSRYTSSTFMGISGGAPSPGITPTPTPPPGIGGGDLIAGTGFDAATAQPAAVGTPGSFGYSARAIARWNVVPYDTIDDALNIGVVAFHVNGIERVDISLDGGPWLPITEASYNPHSGTIEYWATLRANAVSDGYHELRAIVRPRVGVARVLQGDLTQSAIHDGTHSLFISTNGNGSLPKLVRYVSPTGNDASGNGSAAQPFRTIMKAVHSMHVAQGGNADGGTVYLLPGNHLYGTYQFSQYSIVNRRFLTISAAPDVAREDVNIVGAGGSEGLYLGLVRVQNLTVRPPSSGAVIRSVDSLPSYLHVHNVRFIGRGRAELQDWIGGWQGTAVTNSSFENGSDGVAASLVRNVTVHNIASDSFSHSGMVINSTTYDVDHRTTSFDFHPDIYQKLNDAENIILYGLYGAGSIKGQGLFMAPTIPLIRNMAVIDCVFDNQSLLNNPNGTTGAVGLAFQGAGSFEHVYFKGVTVRGSAAWILDWQFETTRILFSAQDVVVEGSNFNGASRPSPDQNTNQSGVLYR